MIYFTITQGLIDTLTEYRERERERQREREREREREQREYTSQTRSKGIIS
jgi:hypothetical protein